MSSRFIHIEGFQSLLCVEYETSLVYVPFMLNKGPSYGVCTIGHGACKPSFCKCGTGTDRKWALIDPHRPDLVRYLMSIENMRRHASILVRSKELLKTARPPSACRNNTGFLKQGKQRGKSELQSIRGINTTLSSAPDWYVPKRAEGFPQH